MPDVFQTVTTTLSVGSNSHLPFQSVGHGVSVQQVIVDTKNTVFTISLTQALQLVQSSGEVQTLDPKNQAIVSAVAVTPSILKDKSKTVPNQAVAVNPIVGFNLDLARSLSDSLDLQQSLAIWKTTYHYVDPGIEQYLAGLTSGSVTFTWTTHSITLRKPEFGNTDEYSAFRVDRTNRGGDLQILQDPMWPTTEILAMEWKFLSSGDIIALLAFLNVSLGHVIEFTDYIGRTWQGHILTPSAECVQKGRFDNTVKLKFQGVLQ